MKTTRYILLCILLSGILSGITGCKTTEANYKAAYDAAKAKRDADNADISLPMGVNPGNRNTPAMTTVAEGIAFPMATEFIRNEDKSISGRDDIDRYTVVVGGFKQVFNARALAKRLKREGEPEPLIFQNSPGLFFVGTLTTRLPAEALQELRRIETDTTIHTATPFPYVIRAAHHAR